MATQKREPRAALTVLVGGFVAYCFAWATLTLYREILHYNCSWGIGGEWGDQGSWSCGDGIGYLGAGIGLGGMSALLLLAGLLTAIARPSTRRTVIFLTLATMSVAWAAWFTYQGATLYTGPRPDGETGSTIWVTAVAPAVLVCTFGLLLGAAACFTRGRWSRIALWSSLGLIVIGTLLQPGIGMATMVSGGMLAAAAVHPPKAREADVNDR